MARLSEAQTCETCAQWRQDNRFLEEGEPAGSVGWCHEYGYTCVNRFGCPSHAAGRAALEKDDKQSEGTG